MKNIILAALLLFCVGCNNGDKNYIDHINREKSAIDKERDGIGRTKIKTDEHEVGSEFKWISGNSYYIKSYNDRDISDINIMKLKKYNGETSVLMKYSDICNDNIYYIYNSSDIYCDSRFNLNPDYKYHTNNPGTIGLIIGKFYTFDADKAGGMWRGKLVKIDDDQAVFFVGGIMNANVRVNIKDIRSIYHE